MFSDWPFVLFVAAFFFAIASLIFGDLILLGVGLLCAVIGNILEKKGVKND
jgi:hypothetical protein